MSERKILDRTYDVENHLRSLQYTMSHSIAIAGQGQALPPPTGSPGAVLTIGWGPNGHPIRVPVYANPLGSAGYMTLHWDGDTILFVTDGSGYVIDFKVGIDGDITPRDQTYTGLTVYDRDAAGVIVQASNTQRSSGFNPLDPSPASGNYFGGAMVQAQYVRSDGFIVANGIQINGVRAYDATLKAWTTPDAYQGTVHDPVSQQKYMWNRGNSVDYRDPRGYDAIVHVDGRNVTITLPVTFVGGTDAERARVVKEIESFWSGNVSGVYNVTTRVVKGAMNTIRIDPKGPVYVLKRRTMNDMYLNMTDDNITYGIRHETGHLLGIVDKYDHIDNAAGQMIRSYPWDGFEEDIMGANGGKLIMPSDIADIIGAKQNVVSSETEGK